jgi:hypothetical protein
MEVKSDMKVQVEMKVEAGIEGGGTTWWYICEGCHCPINYREKTCRSCNAEIDWSSVELLAKPIYHGEMTEPAE